MKNGECDNCKKPILLARWLPDQPIFVGVCRNCGHKPINNFNSGTFILLGSPNKLDINWDLEAKHQLWPDR